MAKHLRLLCRMASVAVPAMLGCTPCFGEGGSFGIQATVLDARTLRGPREPVTMRLDRGGNIEERTSGVNPREIPLVVVGGEVDGIYNLRFTVPGYEPVEVNGVRVRSDRCSRVKTVHLDIRVQPLLP